MNGMSVIYITFCNVHNISGVFFWHLRTTRIVAMEF